MPNGPAKPVRSCILSTIIPAIRLSRLDGIALCLSGGGYRAMLFHLGTLWRLNELHYLPKLNRVSSVSGGSITNGVLAMNWSKLGFDDNGFAQNFDQQVTQPIRRMASESIDISSILEGIFGGVSKHVADHYNKYLYNHAKLQTCRMTTRARASSSTPPACKRACCGASPSRTWATTKLAW